MAIGRRTSLLGNIGDQAPRTAANIFDTPIDLGTDTGAIEKRFPFENPREGATALAEALGLRTINPTPYTNHLINYADLMSRLLGAQSAVSGGGIGEGGFMPTSTLVQRLQESLKGGGGLTSPGLLRQIGDLQQRDQGGLGGGQLAFLNSIDPGQSAQSRQAARDLFTATQYSGISPMARGSLDDVFNQLYSQYSRGSGADPNKSFWSYLAERFR